MIIGNDYALAGSWTRAIHAHTAAVDGLLYPLRRPAGAGRLYAVARFERAYDALRFEPWGALGARAVSAQRSWTARFPRDFDVRLIRRPPPPGRPSRPPDGAAGYTHYRPPAPHEIAGFPRPAGGGTC